MKISKVDCSASPVARSYGGYQWEGVMPRPLHPDCNVATGDCSIIVDETQAVRALCPPRVEWGAGTGVGTGADTSVGTSI